MLIFCTIGLICAVAAGFSVLLFRDGAPPSSTPGSGQMSAEANTPQDGQVPEKQPAVPVLEAGTGKTAPPAPEPETKQTVVEPGPLVAEDLAALPPTTATDAAPVRVPALEEFDDAFIQSLPRFTIAGHVYSDDPELRMILINNRVVREKDIVEKNYIIDEITPEGIVMRFGEIRFHLPAH